jgi:hypothetical protein
MHQMLVTYIQFAAPAHLLLHVNIEQLIEVEVAIVLRISVWLLHTMHLLASGHHHRIHTLGDNNSVTIARHRWGKHW